MAMAWWKPRYSKEVLRKAQDSVNRHRATVVDSDAKEDGDTKPQNKCFKDTIVPGDDGNQVCPEHPEGRCN